MSKKNKVYSIIKFAILVLFLVAAVYFVNYSAFEGRFGVHGIRDLVDSAGIYSSLVFVLAYAALVILLVPAFLLNFVGAIVFGVFEGTVLNCIGGVIGAVVSFFLAKWLGRDFFENFISKKVRRFDALFRKLKFDGVFLIRSILLLPFSEVNYFLGISGVRFKDYFWGTLLGTILPTFVLTYLSAALGEAVIANGAAGLLDWRILPSVVLFSLLALAPFIYRRFAKK